MYVCLMLLQLDADGNGTIELDELGHALQTCGIKIPQYKVRMLVEDIARKDDKNKDGKIDMEEFRNVSTGYMYCFLFHIFLTEDTTVMT